MLDEKLAAKNNDDHSKFQSSCALTGDSLDKLHRSIDRLTAAVSPFVSEAFLSGAGEIVKEKEPVVKNPDSKSAYSTFIRVLNDDISSLTKRVELLSENIIL